MVRWAGEEGLVQGRPLESTRVRKLFAKRGIGWRTDVGEASPAYWGKIRALWGATSGEAWAGDLPTSIEREARKGLPKGGVSAKAIERGEPLSRKGVRKRKKGNTIFREKGVSNHIGVRNLPHPRA